MVAMRTSNKTLIIRIVNKETYYIDEFITDKLELDQYGKALDKINQFFNTKKTSSHNYRLIIRIFDDVNHKVEELLFRRVDISDYTKARDRVNEYFGIDADTNEQ